MPSACGTRLDCASRSARSQVPVLDHGRPLDTQIEALLERRRDRPDTEGGAPTTRAAFERRHEVRRWPCETVERSLPKPLPRRICRDPDGTAAVAWTLLTDGAVRETETAVAREDGRGFDHAV